MSDLWLAGPLGATHTDRQRGRGDGGKKTPANEKPSKQYLVDI